MTFKDLSAFITPDLIITLGDKRYTVHPPDFRTGLKLAAIIDYSQLLAVGAEIPKALQERYDSMDLNQPVGELSLGKDVLEQIKDDGVPGPTVTKLSQYALYYWALGEEVADRIFAATAEEDEAPKASLTSLSTGSESPTTTASTPDTASRTSSAPKAPAKRAAGSRGGKSSTAGAQ